MHNAQGSTALLLRWALGIRHWVLEHWICDEDASQSQYLPATAIGKEVVPRGHRGADGGPRRSAASRLISRRFHGAAIFYLKNGRMMDADAVDQLKENVRRDLSRRHRAIRRCPTTSRRASCCCHLRRRLVQYVNLRPVRLPPASPHRWRDAGAADIDIVCVRENSEGEYCGLGGRVHSGTSDEIAEQTGIFTRRGIERIARYGLRDGGIASAQAPRKRHQIERAPAFDDAVG